VTSTSHSAERRQRVSYANVAHPVQADGRHRCRCSTHVGNASLGGDVSSAYDWKVAMLTRAFLVVLTALLLSGCVDSERFREDHGPRDYDRDYDRTERLPGR